MTKRQIIWLLLMIIVMGVIFYFSNQPSEQSHAISNAVAEEVHVEGNQFQEASSMPLLLGLNFRKWAHIALFGLLGLTAWFEFNSLWRSLIVCYAYACFDEFHQLFASGRTANVTDTLIDAIGFGTVILICFIVSRVSDRRKSNSEIAVDEDLKINDRREI